MTLPAKYLSCLGCALLAGVLTSAAAPGSPPPAPSTAETTPAAPTLRTAHLEECLATARQNHRRRPASQLAVAMAEAQHRQALSTYWPQLHAKGGYLRADEAPGFLFPATTIAVPGQTLTVPAGTATVLVPAQLLNPAAPPTATVALPVATPAQTITTGPQSLAVPAQEITMADRDHRFAGLQATWLLYDGGLRRGLTDQGQALVDLARQTVRRTDLEIEDCVRRYYHGAVLARLLHEIGRDTLARLEATLTLTEALYQGSGGRVKKTDWLDTKVTVEAARVLVATLEKNETLAQAALAHAMGLDWQASVAPADTALPFAPVTDRAEALVGEAYRFNPDWTAFAAGLRAAEGGVRSAQSGHHPRVALTGSLQKWWNDSHTGMAIDRNKEGWTVGLGCEIPLFDGGLTRAKVAEARARLAKLQEEKFLLREGLGLQIREVLLGLVAAQKSERATAEASRAAAENRDLQTRAYQNDLVETEKVVRAQLTEALMTAQHQRMRYDHLALRSRLNLLVGTEVTRQLGLAATP